MALPFRLVTWNLSWTANAEARSRQIELIRKLAPDLLALQEVRRWNVAAVAESELFTWSCFSNDLDVPFPKPGVKIGCALLGRSSLQLVAAHRLSVDRFANPGVPDWLLERFSNRSVVGELSVDGGPSFLAGGFHATPGTAKGVGPHKPWFHTGIARFLADAAGPFLFAIDANEPLVDHPEFESTKFHYPPAVDDGPGMELLLGPAPLHRARDVLRTLLEGRDTWDALTFDPPDGPLAVSYRLPVGGPRRFDQVWATPEFAVHDVQYLYEEACAAGSDHAVLVVDLEV